MRKRNRRVLFAVLAILLLAFFHAAWKLMPIETSPLLRQVDGDLRREITDDLARYRELLKTADELSAVLVDAPRLRQTAATLGEADRENIRTLWRRGVVAYQEAEALKEKYRGFPQIDFKVKPALHADAFFVAYASLVGQYDLCLKISGLATDNAPVRALLNEPADGIPAQSFETMKNLLTDSDTLLRLNAWAAYYELVEEHFTVPPDLVEDHRMRRSRVFARLGQNLGKHIGMP